MSLHLYDGNSWSPCADLDEARRRMDEAICIARDLCDPEWPEYVEQIAVYEAPEDCEEPDARGKPVLVTKMVHIRDAEPGEGVDFWCDFEISEPRPPKGEDQ